MAETTIDVLTFRRVMNDFLKNCNQYSRQAGVFPAGDPHSGQISAEFWIVTDHKNENLLDFF
jgi:hypothetical protein